MKLSKRSNLILFGSLLTIAVVGCKTNRLGTTPLPGAGTSNLAAGPGKALIDDGNKTASGEAAAASTAISNPDIRKDWPRDREIFKSDTVHFDFDSSVITEAEK